MGLPMDSNLFPKLYRNNGDGTFTDVAKKMHLGYETFTMGCNFGDLDNDGWLDFYLGIGAPDYKAIFPNRMFHNHGGQFFEDCTISGGFSCKKGTASRSAILITMGIRMCMLISAAFTGAIYLEMHCMKIRDSVITGSTSGLKE